VQDLVASRDTGTRDRYLDKMDEMVTFAIRLQEEAGLDVVSDGEWRRNHYITDFLTRIGGFETVRKFKHQGEEKLTDVVVRPITVGDPVFSRDADFLVAHTDRVTKFALPSPFLIATRYWHEEHSVEAYPTRQHFIDHLVEALRNEAQAIANAGIDILQLDDPAITYFCDQNVMQGNTHDERLRQEWDIDKQIPMAVSAINAIVEGLPLSVHLHCCHSVYKRMSDVSGNYKPVLPRLGNARIDCLNLEFAYTGTGDVTDLEELPEHLDVGLGIVDIRTESPQSVEQMVEIGSRAARILPPERIAINPDCGFAPGAAEPPSIDEAFEKLKRMCAAARRLREIHT
jgi:5-methyltetrahydropteroyltriglutamate--homocysteine methyltransferase